MPRQADGGDGAGKQQIARSMRQAETLRLTLPLLFAAQPGDCVAVRGDAIGAEGEYIAASVRNSIGAHGEYMELELRKERGICG